MGFFDLLTDPLDLSGSKAAETSAAAQQAATEASIAEQRRQFDITQGRIQPFFETGVDALEQQRILLGLGASTPTQPAPTQQAPQLGAFGGQIPGFGGTGPGGIRIPQLAGLTAPRAGVTIDGATGQVEPQLSALEQQQQAFAAFGDSPGQRFIRERAQRNLLRNASAIGGLGGGNIRSALVQQGAGFAAQDFQNQLNRLAGLSGTGQTSAAQLGQFGQNFAQQFTQAQTAKANALTSGIQAQQQGKSQLLGLGLTAAAAFSDSRLKENVHRIARLDNGLGWYIWDWKEEAKELVGDQIGEGVMAHEVLVKIPEAVSLRDGFLTVDYGRIM